jgi:hypothetical protein
VLEQQEVVRRFIANTNQSVKAQSERLLKLGCQSGSPGKITIRQATGAGGPAAEHGFLARPAGERNDQIFFNIRAGEGTHLAMLALDTSDLRHEARHRWRAAICQHFVGPAGVADHPDPTEVEHAVPVMVPVNP